MIENLQNCFFLKKYLDFGNISSAKKKGWYGVLCRSNISMSRKMVATMFKKRIYMQPMRWLNIHPKEFIFYPFEGGEGVRIGFFKFLCSHHVPSLFPYVPMMFPKGVPNSTSIYPMSFTSNGRRCYHGGGKWTNGSHGSILCKKGDSILFELCF